MEILHFYSYSDHVDGIGFSFFYWVSLSLIYIYYFYKPKSPVTSAPNLYYVLIMVSFYQVNHPESLFSCSYFNQIKLRKGKILL